MSLIMPVPKPKRWLSMEPRNMPPASRPTPRMMEPRRLPLCVFAAVPALAFVPAFAEFAPGAVFSRSFALFDGA